ncbi:hypothetical protein Tco_0738074 [Tanacetum coccineum]
MLGPAFKLLKGTRSNVAKLEYDFEECYKALSEKLDWENPKGSDYPFDLSKPLPLITRGKRQRVPFEYFINNDLKYLQGGVSTMTYTTSTTKTKAAQYDLPGIKDMNRLTNLLGDDVADFTIALRMFTRSLVIQKRVEDLQLGVKSYQKKINVTKPDTTRPDLKKGTRTLHTKTLKDSFMSMTTRGIEYQHRVLAEEKMEHIVKQKSLFHDQGHQQAAKGKEDDEEFGEICWQ